ncbi:zinc-finger associated domain (zf-AD) domain-containing protein [Phthorimaea operculella]|nr:zinc-finger associated domain (zf-AD) domain-containing protein [Phthorimaea operculella]
MTSKPGSDKPFGQCRCCLKTGYHHEDIAKHQEVFWTNFNLFLSTYSNLTNLICESCVNRLNDAAEFKAMVVESERQLLIQMKAAQKDSECIQIKIENIEEDESSSYTTEKGECNNTIKVKQEIEEPNEFIDKQEENNSTTYEVPVVKCEPPNADDNEIRSETHQADDKDDSNAARSSRIIDDLLNKYSCTTCKYRCKTVGLLRAHLRAHDAPSQFVCDICHHITKNKYGLMRHVTKHTGEKPYACHICNRQFNRKSYIKDHMRSHAPEKRLEFASSKINSEIVISNHLDSTKNVELSSVSYEENKKVNQSDGYTEETFQIEKPRSLRVKPRSSIGRTFGRPFMKKVIGGLIPVIFQLGAASTWAVVSAIVGIKTLLVTLFILKLLLLAGAAKFGALFANKGHSHQPHWEPPLQKEIHLHIHNKGQEHYEEHVPYSSWNREGYSTQESNPGYPKPVYAYSGPQTISTPYGHYVKIDSGPLVTAASTYP